MYNNIIINAPAVERASPHIPIELQALRVIDASFDQNNTAGRLCPPACVPDLTYLREFTNGDSAFEREMLESTMDDMDDELIALRNAVTNRTGEAVSQIAHSLKSLSAIIGVSALQTIFRELENRPNEAEVSEQVCQQLQHAEELWQIARCHVIGLIEENNHF